MKPVCHIVAGPNGAGKSKSRLCDLPEYADWPRDCREVQEAMDRASWDAIEGYRQTGEMVPVLKDGKLAFVTVEEAFSARPDCAERKRADADWRLDNLLEQFKAAGVEITPDVWDRLEADRRQALEDDLSWIRRGRKENAR